MIDKTVAEDKIAAIEHYRSSASGRGGTCLTPGGGWNIRKETSYGEWNEWLHMDQ